MYAINRQSQGPPGRRRSSQLKRRSAFAIRIVAAAVLYTVLSTLIGWWGTFRTPTGALASVTRTIVLQVVLLVLFLIVLRRMFVRFVLRPLQHRAHYDDLTGLLRAGSFWERAEDLMQRALVTQYPVAFVFLDLDDFKHINDEFGHATGDLVLQSIGALLRREIRKGDLIGRLGGEEFGWLMVGTTGEEAFAVTQRVLTACAQLNTPGRPQIGLSGGLAVVDGRAMSHITAWDLARKADQALYRAKANGKGHVRRAEN